MYSEWKRTFCKVKDSFQTQKIWLIFIFVWVCVCTLGMVENVSSKYMILGVNTSAIDYIIYQQEANFSGIQIFPFIFLSGMKCKCNSIEIQHILRYKTKAKLFRSQLRESLVYSTVAGGVLVGLSAVIGYIQSGVLLNWSDMGSVYFYKTGGETLQGNFCVLVGVAWLFYILKFMILFQIMDILLWFSKWLFLFWVMYLVVLVVEIGYVGKILFKVFSIDYILCKTPIAFVLLILLGSAVLCIEHILGIQLIRQRDVGR